MKLKPHRERPLSIHAACNRDVSLDHAHQPRTSHSITSLSIHACARAVFLPYVGPPRLGPVCEHDIHRIPSLHRVDDRRSNDSFQSQSLSRRARVRGSTRGTGSTILWGVRRCRVASSVCITGTFQYAYVHLCFLLYGSLCFGVLGIECHLSVMLLASPLLSLLAILRLPAIWLLPPGSPEPPTVPSHYPASLSSPKLANFASRLL